MREGSFVIPQKRMYQGGQVCRGGCGGVGGLEFVDCAIAISRCYGLDIVLVSGLDVVVPVADDDGGAAGQARQ